MIARIIPDTKSNYYIATNFSRLYDIKLILKDVLYFKQHYFAWTTKQSFNFRKRSTIKANSVQLMKRRNNFKDVFLIQAIFFFLIKKNHIWSIMENNSTDNLNFKFNPNFRLLDCCKRNYFWYKNISNKIQILKKIRWQI